MARELTALIALPNPATNAAILKAARNAEAARAYSSAPESPLLPPRQTAHQTTRFQKRLDDASGAFWRPASLEHALLLYSFQPCAHLFDRATLLIGFQHERVGYPRLGCVASEHLDTGAEAVAPMGDEGSYRFSAKVVRAQEGPNDRRRCLAPDGKAEENRLGTVAASAGSTPRSRS